MNFRKKGHVIYQMGRMVEDLGSSDYLYHYRGVKNSPAPYLNLDDEAKLQGALLKLIDQELIYSAHDISDGGAAITLLESAFPNNMGFVIETPVEIREDAFLYGEAGGRAIVTVDPRYEEEFLEVASEFGVEVLVLGSVTGGKVVIDGENLGDIQDFKDIYMDALGKNLEK